MKVSAAYIQAFTAQLDALNAQAGKTIVTEAAKLDLERRLLEADELAYEDLYTLMHQVCPAYSKLASALTCHYYDGIRSGSNVPGEFKAVTYNTLSERQIKADAYAIADDVAHGRNTIPLQKIISDKNTQYTRIASNETVRRNAIKDPAKPLYATVPNHGACPFCLMVASNGYVYPDSAAANAHKPHENCSCTAAQVYGKGKIQGYDPTKYAKQYEEARDAYIKGDYSDELKQRIKDARERHNEKYSANKEAEEKGLPKPYSGFNEPWRDYNAYMMVWREQDKQQ